MPFIRVVISLMFIATAAFGVDGFRKNTNVCGAVLGELANRDALHAREAVEHLGNVLGDATLAKMPPRLRYAREVLGAEEQGTTQYVHGSLTLWRETFPQQIEVETAPFTRDPVLFMPRDAKAEEKRQRAVYGPQAAALVQKEVAERKAVAQQFRGREEILSFLNGVDSRAGAPETARRRYTLGKGLVSQRFPVPVAVSSVLVGMLGFSAATVALGNHYHLNDGLVAMATLATGLSGPFATLFAVVKSISVFNRGRFLRPSHGYDVFDRGVREAVDKGATTPLYVGMNGPEGQKVDLLFGQHEGEPTLSVFVTGEKALGLEPKRVTPPAEVAPLPPPKVEAHVKIEEPAPVVREVAAPRPEIDPASVAKRREAAVAAYGTTPGEMPTPAAIDSVRRLENFFGGVNARLAERDRVLMAIARALIAKEHVLLLGPGGTAKSYLSDLLFENIGDEHGTSYGRLFLNEGTTTNQTHGPYSPRALSEDQYKRLYDQGLAKFRRLLLDELFDPSPMVQRSLMELLNERRLSDGNHVEKSALETAVAATNQLMAAVYKRGGASSMGPVFDRFGGIYYVDGDLGKIKSIDKLGGHSGEAPFLDEQVLRDAQRLADKVTVPDEMKYALYWVNMTMKAGAGKLNEKWEREAIAAGDDRAPSHTSRTYSLRFYGKTLKMVRSEVVLDLAGNPGRKFRAELADIERLEDVFTMGGDETAAVEKRKNRGEPEERQQKQVMLAERELFQKTWTTLRNGVENSPEMRTVNESAARLGGAEHGAAVEKLVGIVERGNALRHRIDKEDLPVEELTPANIAVLFSATRAADLLAAHP